MFAEVIIDIKHHDVNHTYDYNIEKALIPILEVGMRVHVPFSHTVRTGIIIHIKETSQTATKSIMDVDASMPVISKQSLSHIHHLVKNNHMLYQQAIELIVPHVFQFKYRYTIHVRQEDPLLNSLDMKVIDKKYVLLKRDERHLKKLKLLHQDGKIHLEQTQISHLPKRPSSVYVYTKKPYQRLDTILELLTPNEPYQKETLFDMGLTQSNIKTLLKHEVLLKKDNLNEVTTQTKTPEKGKKNIFIKPFESMLKSLVDLIKEVRFNQQSLLILVPNRKLLLDVQSYCHLTLAYDYKTTSKQYLNLVATLNKTPSIVVSTRKGIFLPYLFDHIFIVESHSKTYRYDQGVFYDTLETIDLLFPDAHIYYHSYVKHPSIAIQSKEVTIMDHSNVTHKKHIHVVSMKDELISGHTKVLSRSVLEASKEALKKQHVVMYYPRKGYQKVNVCRLCGDVQTCPNCHKKLHVTQQKKTYCTTCHITFELHHTCSHDHQNMMKPLGLGLEYIAKHLERLIPGHDVIVIDKDHQDNQKVKKPSIFIGTQKLISHLHEIDFNLSVIILADISFHYFGILDDEHNFMDVLSFLPYGFTKINTSYIQTYDPEHPFIKGLLNPEAYMKEVLKNRQLLSLPPFFYLFEIYVEHVSFFKGYQHALNIQQALHEKNIQVIGPIYEETQPFRLLMKLNATQLDTFYTFVRTQGLHSRRIQ
jgi:primosomal protein N' (replication factor Y)